MKIAIYGAGVYGKMALSLLEEHGLKSDLVGFVDSKKDGEYLGFPIVSIDSIEKETACIIAMSDSKDVLEVYQYLIKKQMKNIYWFRLGSKKYNSNSFLEEYCEKLENLEGCVLPHVEMHIMDACNLNCKGCAHFSPIFEREIPNFDERIRDVRLIKEKVDNILMFYILGGEPFLNPEVGKYAQEIRKILPDTYIQITTNGLLIPKLPQDVLKAIKDANVTIAISEYEPTSRVIEDIKATLEKAEVTYISNKLREKQKFYLPLTLKESDESTYFGCPCTTIWNGKIARCPQLMYMEYFNKYFNTSFPTDGVLRLENCPEGEELKEYLRKEVSLCKHCVMSEIDWSVCGKNASLSDFVVDC